MRASRTLPPLTFAVLLSLPAILSAASNSKRDFSHVEFALNWLLILTLPVLSGVLYRRALKRITSEQPEFAIRSGRSKRPFLLRLFTRTLIQLSFTFTALSAFILLLGYQPEDPYLQEELTQSLPGALLACLSLGSLLAWLCNWLGPQVLWFVLALCWSLSYFELPGALASPVEHLRILWDLHPAPPVDPHVSSWILLGQFLLFSLLSWRFTPR